MRFWWLLLVACGGTDPPTVAPVPPIPPTVDPADDPPPVKKSTPERAARVLLMALKPCDEGAALAQIATFEEVKTLSRKPKDKSDYDAHIRDFVRKTCAELEGAQRIVDVKVESTRTIAKSEHETLERDLEVVTIRPIVEQNGTTHEANGTLMFVRLENVWKLLVN